MCASYRFNGSSRNSGQKAEDKERRLLITRSLGKQFLTRLFQAMPNTRNSTIPLGAGFPPAPGCSPPLSHSSVLILCTTYQQSEWARCPRCKVRTSYLILCLENYCTSMSQWYRRPWLVYQQSGLEPEIPSSNVFRL